MTDNDIKAVIFDLDGTLIDSSDGVVEAVNYSLKQVGAPEQAPEVIRAFIGYPLSHMYPHFTDVPVERLYPHFRRIADTSVIEATRSLPGADRTVRELRRRGYQLAIATTKVRHNIDSILSKLDWEELFDTTVGGDEVKHQKPAPDAFEKAMVMMDAAPNDSLVVGDTINDVTAAQLIPVRIAAVKSPYGGNEKMRKLNPDYFFEQVSELLDHLK